MSLLSVSLGVWLADKTRCEVGSVIILSLFLPLFLSVSLFISLSLIVSLFIYLSNHLSVPGRVKVDGIGCVGVLCYCLVDRWMTGGWITYEILGEWMRRY